MISFDPGSLMSAPDVSLQGLPQRGGMFGGGGWQNALMAAAAGFMARRSPQVANNLFDSLQRKQILAQQEAQYQAHRNDDLNSQIALYDYKLKHPEQSASDISARIADLNAVEPGLGNTYAHNYAANGGGLGAIVNPMTGQTMIPAGKAPVQAPPAEAVARLKANPGEAQQFDEIFGPGASQKILGGPTARPSGGFPY